MVEIGSQAWLYGGLVNAADADGQIVSYPTADYKVDGDSGESPQVAASDKTLT
jgi:hypothetical protein